MTAAKIPLTEAQLARKTAYQIDPLMAQRVVVVDHDGRRDSDGWAALDLRRRRRGAVQRGCLVMVLALGGGRGAWAIATMGAPGAVPATEAPVSAPAQQSLGMAAVVEIAEPVTLPAGGIARDATDTRPGRCEPAAQAVGLAGVTR